MTTEHASPANDRADLTAEEVSAAAGVSVSVVRRLAAMGRFPGAALVHAGRGEVWRIPRTAIATVVEAAAALPDRPVDASAPPHPDPRQGFGRRQGPAQPDQQSSDREALERDQREVAQLRSALQADRARMAEERQELEAERQALVVAVAELARDKEEVARRGLEVARREAHLAARAGAAAGAAANPPQTPTAHLI